MGYRVAVVGATGNVGREILNILEERVFPIDKIYAVASSRSVGRDVVFGDQNIKVKALEYFDFAKADLAMFSAGAEVAKQWAPKAAAAGCVVIDNSSAFRMDPEVPLVVPEVNGESIANYSQRNIIANPNCSTAQMVVALKPLHDMATIRRVVVSTYQSTSGAGKNAMDELFSQTKGIYVNDAPNPRNFSKQIAFNVIPHIDQFMEDGSTKEEWKMAAETKKILDKSILLTATCVRVATFVGHAEAINIEFVDPIDEENVRSCLREAPGCMLVDKREDGGYVTPVDCVGEFATYISRLRVDPTVENGLNIWVVSDNLRKGAALNAVQIAEILVSRHLKKAA